MLRRLRVVALHCAVSLAHLVLISLMLVASLIDADEKIIPDAITVPGTLLGLLLAAACSLVAAAQRRRHAGRNAVSRFPAADLAQPAGRRC